MATAAPLPARYGRAEVAFAADQVAAADSPHSVLTVITPTEPGVDLAGWLRVNRERVTTLLGERAALLFRGFPVAGPTGFHAIAAAWSPQLLDYTYGSSPSSRAVASGVQICTEYRAEQAIPQHNEMAFARIWPGYLWFYCQTAAAHGGATPLADGRGVAARLDPALLREFAARGLRYRRDYGSGFDRTWQQAFGTGDRGEVEARCAARGVEFTWLGGDRLRTSQACHAVIRHPASGRRVWFSQPHLFDAPTFAQVRYGNGDPIPAAVLDEVRAAIVAETVREPWRAGDVLLLDNMLVSHGRDPYEGPRCVLMAMTDEPAPAGW